MLRQRFLITGALAAVALAILLTVGFAAAPTAKRDPGENDKSDHQVRNLAATPDKTSEVKGLYTKYCLACHGADGKGTAVKPAMPAIPDFTSRTWQDATSNVQIKVSILEGKGTLMPPFRDKVSDEENGELSAYLREFAVK